RDGVIDLDQLKKEKMSRQQMFAMLRNNNYFNLGQVERAYLEANGSLSVYSFNDQRPGLSLLPPSDKKIREAQHSDIGKRFACSSCGHINDERESSGDCRNCGEKNWDKAIYRT